MTNNLIPTPMLQNNESADKIQLKMNSYINSMKIETARPRYIRAMQQLDKTKEREVSDSSKNDTKLSNYLKSSFAFKKNRKNLSPTPILRRKAKTPSVMKVFPTNMNSNRNSSKDKPKEKSKEVRIQEEIQVTTLDMSQVIQSEDQDEVVKLPMKIDTESEAVPTQLSASGPSNKEILSNQKIMLDHIQYFKDLSSKAHIATKDRKAFMKRKDYPGVFELDSTIDKDFRQHMI